jgi:hypothetical protein
MEKVFGPVAIFYQNTSPENHGHRGADIAYALKSQHITVVTPVLNPEAQRSLDWVFPEDPAGIQAAYHLGARTFWMQQNLYEFHPHEKIRFPGISFVAPKAPWVQKDEGIDSSQEFRNEPEIKIHVLPPGPYEIQGEKIYKKNFWCLPPIRNRQILNEDELDSSAIQKMMEECAEAAKRAEFSTVLGFSCRERVSGGYEISEIDAHPDLSGAGRPGRDDQDSLCTLSARSMGWSYFDLLFNLLAQAR